MSIIAMTVSDLIAHLQTLPPGHDVFVATRDGNEPLTKENMRVTRTDGRVPVPAVIFAPTTREGVEAIPADELMFGDDDNCAHADECMHFERSFESRQRRRHANLAACRAHDAKRN